MLKDENIICISSIDWDFNWQGHQEIMATFAREGNKVLFIENTGVRPPALRDIPRLKKRIKNWLRGVSGIRQENNNLFVFSPLAVPFPYSKIARLINKFLLLSTLKRWINVMDFTNPVIWTFLPTGITLDLINNIGRKLLVYYCIAEFGELVKDARKIKESERQLLQKADVVFVQGQQLKEYCQRYNSNVYIFPFGVSLDNFASPSLKGQERPADLKSIEGLIAGYVGGLHKHVDYELIEFLAENNPQWSLVFVGPVQTEVSRISGFKNVFLLGEKNHTELPRYIAAFDVCLIPYLLSEYTSTVYPTKLNEYLIMGKPVISTELPEIVTFNKRYNDIVSIGKSYQQFNDFIVKTSGEETETLQAERIAAAQNNSWSRRIEQMAQIMEDAIRRRQLNKYLSWKEDLISFYRKTRTRLLKTATLCFLTYFLLFYTPLIWFLARPLKISQVPAAADAIVVFGGGVGEAGSPGKSTIERARYAAELYKSGFARRVIFSSGYVYKYNDAENMKLIALSVGVREKDIILEQKANNAYENAKFTKEILDENNWYSILLVSSPYNMLRSSLAFKKLDRNLKIIYTPVIKPKFYQRNGKIEWRQMRAITHEYLGIVYYWWKGYI